MNVPHASFFLKQGRFYVSILSVGVLLFFIKEIVFPKSKTSVEDEIMSEWRRSPLWVEDQKPQINPHKFQYLKNHPHYCNSKEIDLLILVASAPDHFEEREAIRATWAASGALEKYRTKVLFLLGQGKEQQTLIDQESNLCRDIIQEDFQVKYLNVNSKWNQHGLHSRPLSPSLGFLLQFDFENCNGIEMDGYFLPSSQICPENRWWHFRQCASSSCCPQGSANQSNYRYDITFKILEERKVSIQLHFPGCIKNSPIHGFQPIPSGDNPLPMEMMPTAHPEFTAGAGYILPGPLIPELYIAALNTKFLPIEDVFTTGHCAKRIGAHPPLHDSRFSCGEMVIRECQMANMFTGHKVTPEMQFSIFETLSEQACKWIKQTFIL